MDVVPHLESVMTAPQHSPPLFVLLNTSHGPHSLPRLPCMVLLDAVYAIAKGITMSPPCDLGLGSEIFGPGKLVIGLPPNSSLTQPLTKGLLVVEDSGRLSDVQRRW